MQKLANDVALVTGASRGIGAAAARELAAEGAAVVLAARSVGDCEAIAEEIRAGGGKAAAIYCDAGRYDDIVAAVAIATERFGTPSILVNNAAVIDPISHLASSDPQEWTKAININVNGVYYGMRAVLPAMRKARRGVIINISSGAASSPLEGWSHYCASKAAVLMLTRCTQLEVADEGIRVVGLSPGTVATDMQRKIKQSGLNPVSQLEWSDHIPPEWPAKAIVYLCTDEAADLAGGDFSLRPEESRRRVGLIN